MVDNRPTQAAAQRTPLSRERVLERALRVADESGVEALTMRRLAESLGVKPMSIYHHIAGKEQILDGIVDLVFQQIDLPPTELEWTDAMRVRCRSAREVLARHPWATPLMETRTTPGPATLQHHDAVLGCLRRGGLSLPEVANAYAVIDSYVYGFALQEATLPFQDGDEGVEGLAELATQIMASFPRESYPSLAEFTEDHVLQPGYRFADSFEIGLDLILDGLKGRAGT